MVETEEAFTPYGVEECEDCTLPHAGKWQKKRIAPCKWCGIEYTLVPFEKKIRSGYGSKMITQYFWYKSDEVKQCEHCHQVIVNNGMRYRNEVDWVITDEYQSSSCRANPKNYHHEPAEEPWIPDA